jgi:hypothetical protein
MFVNFSLTFRYIKLIQFLKQMTDILDPQWIAEHDSKISKLMIPNPWVDPSVKKVGLYDMYIINALSETLELSAEEDPDVKLGCISKLYTTMHKMVSDFLDEPSEEGFNSIIAFSEKYLKRKIRLINWIIPEGKDPMHWPDIRLLETPDECLSWLKRLGRGNAGPP